MIGCHRCGGRSRAGARFCGACGAALGTARTGVRKIVMVLFAHAPELAGGHDLESRVRLGPERNMALKGRSSELTVVPLVGLDAPVRGPRGPFVGRDAEKRMLLAALDRTLNGRVVQFVTVLGEPGTGKSRLVEEVVAL